MIKTGKRLKLNYLYGGEVVYQPSEKLGPRLLTDFELVYIISGEVTYTVDKQSFAAPPGTFILGQAGTTEAYQWDIAQTTRHAYFHFAIDCLPMDWPSPHVWPRVRPHAPQVAVGLFRHILQHIYEHSDWPTVAPSERDCLLVETLLDTFFETHNKEEKSFEQDRPEPVRRAIKWLREQIDEQPSASLTLQDIADAASCTPKHLCRLFKNSIGHSPARTATLMRLQLSLSLLTRTNLNITEIAQRCGFDNPLYFSRCFSKTFGQPPTRVRHNVTQGSPPPTDPLPIDITPRLHW